MSHTPGPWRVVGPRGEDIAGPRGEDLAYVNASDGADDPVLYPAQANARLIAAAPDLLDALKDALGAAWMDPAPNAICHSGLTTMEKCTRCQRVLKMRAAVAKAEGRTL